MSYKTTLLPEYVDVVQATSINFYNTSTNILDAIGDYVGELNQSIEFEKSKVTTNYITSIGELFNALNSQNFLIENFASDGTPTGVKQMDNIFKNFYIEKYLSLSKEYRAKVDKLIAGNVFFKNFSDDIGMIADRVSVMDSNVNPYYDVYDTTYFYPTNLPASVLNKISQDELNVSMMFSYYNDPLLKRNLQGLQSSKKVLGVNVPLVNKLTAKTSHGTNLVTDVLYYDRVFVFQLSILNTLKTILGDLSSFILFIKQINPKDGDAERKAISFNYDLEIEGLNQKVDLLKKQLDLAQYSSQQVLGVD